MLAAAAAATRHTTGKLLEQKCTIITITMRFEKASMRMRGWWWSPGSAQPARASLTKPTLSQIGENKICWAFQTQIFVTAHIRKVVFPVSRSSPQFGSVIEKIGWNSKSNITLN
jgi:hypothetical protein